MARKIYDIGKTTFSNYVWVRGTLTFYDPISISLEKVTNQPLEVKAYDTNGVYQGKVVSEKGYNWVTMPLDWLPRGKSYRLQLVNAGSGTVEIKQGEVVYNEIITA